MRKVEVLIIGGGVAGTMAAETFRSQDPDSEVLLISDEPHRLYSRVLLPHAIKEKIAPEKVFLKTKEWYGEKKIELMAGRTVLRADFRHGRIELDGGEEIGYEKLVIAIGGKPRVWDVPGADLPGVLRLQTVDDAKMIHETARPGSRMTIVGSGFIALEFAAIAAAKGIKATLLNRGPHFWTSVMGEAVGSAVEKALKAQGVDVRNHAKAHRVVGEERVEGVMTSSDETIPCDAVGVGIGIEAPFAPFGDLRGEHGIKADAFLKTTHENVWTAGDCAEFEDELIGLRHVVGNWTNAAAQGRHVGKALLGEKKKFEVLTQYTSNVVAGASLIFLGETKMWPGAARVEKIIEPGRKIIETHLLTGRMIGAILLNCPEFRAETAGMIGKSA